MTDAAPRDTEASLAAEMPIAANPVGTTSMLRRTSATRSA